MVDVFFNLNFILHFFLIFIDMRKVEIDKKTRQAIVKEYNDRSIPVEKMSNKFDISLRVFYRILTEEGVEIKRKPRKYNKPPKNDLTGKRFFHLVVEKMDITKKSKDRSWRSICKCDCGRIADVNTNYLMRNLVKTCGHKDCIYHRQDYSNSGKNNVKFTGYEDISGQFWSSYKCGAERRGFEFSINIEYAWKLFLEQKRKCSLTGREIYFGKTNTSEKTASLDRIDSKKGYIEGNVHWIHKDVNKMKMDLDLKKFISLCKEIANKN